MSAARLTLAIDDQELLLEPTDADRLYEALWDTVYASRSHAALAAAVRLRSFMPQPHRTVGFSGDEAVAVREALTRSRQPPKR